MPVKTYKETCKEACLLCAKEVQKIKGYHPVKVAEGHLVYFQHVKCAAPKRGEYVRGLMQTIERITREQNNQVELIKSQYHKIVKLEQTKVELEKKLEEARKVIS